MNDQPYERQDGVHEAIGFVAGLLIGAVVGAAAMLLFAPQSETRTRAKIQRQSFELRERASESIEDAVSQARKQARKVTADVREHAEELQHRGHDMLEDQKERFSTTIESGKKAVLASRN